MQTDEKHRLDQTIPITPSAPDGEKNNFWGMTAIICVVHLRNIGALPCAQINSFIMKNASAPFDERERTITKKYANLRRYPPPPPPPPSKTANSFHR